MGLFSTLTEPDSELSSRFELDLSKCSLGSFPSSGAFLKWSSSGASLFFERVLLITRGTTSRLVFAFSTGPNFEITSSFFVAFN